MATEWLRLWHDMPNDPKWRTISKASGEPISLVQSMYIHLLVDASRNVTRGHVCVTNEDLASALDCDESQIERIREAMSGRVLEGDSLTGWDRRQPKREDAGNPETGAKSAAQRKREQRERERAEDEKGRSHETSQRVTADKDKDKDKDKEFKPPCASAEKSADAPAPDPKAPEPSPPSEIETEFDQEFWPTYPNHKGKQQALKAFKTFRKRNPGRAKLDHILQDVADRRRRCADWLKADGQFVPMASTYLNNRRWLDPLETNVVGIARQGGPPASVEDDPDFQEFQRLRREREGTYDG